MKKHSIEIVWEIEDVRAQLENRERNEKLTDAECMEILESIKRNHDATIGINWDVIDYAIDDFIRERDRV